MNNTKQDEKVVKQLLQKDQHRFTEFWASIKLCKTTFLSSFSSFVLFHPFHIFACLLYPALLLCHPSFAYHLFIYSPSLSTLPSYRMLLLVASLASLSRLNSTIVGPALRISLSFRLFLLPPLSVHYYGPQSNSVPHPAPPHTNAFPSSANLAAPTSPLPGHFQPLSNPVSFSPSVNPVSSSSAELSSVSSSPLVPPLQPNCQSHSQAISQAISRSF